ncbi:hypothetical protein C6560_06590 [Enterobacter sp. FS01]|nr:hypothetical protein C6560_06590 [Enterobacter sp. FS01]
MPDGANAYQAYGPVGRVSAAPPGNQAPYFRIFLKFSLGLKFFLNRAKVLTLFSSTQAPFHDGDGCFSPLTLAVPPPLYSRSRSQCPEFLYPAGAKPL